MILVNTEGKAAVTCDVCGGRLAGDDLGRPPVEQALREGWELVFSYAACPPCSEQGGLANLRCTVAEDDGEPEPCAIVE